MTLINWLLNPKIHANTYFLNFGNTIWFFTLLRDLTICTIIKTCFCIIFWSEKISRDLFLKFLEISVKNRYFNIGSVSYSVIKPEPAQRVHLGPDRPGAGTGLVLSKDRSVQQPSQLGGLTRGLGETQPRPGGCLCARHTAARIWCLGYLPRG